MRRWVALTLGTALAVGGVGCRNTCARVESELAARESDVRVLKEELGKVEFLNQGLVRELAALRGLPGPHGVVERPTEPWPVRSIALGGLTSTRPSESLPGDDALQVMLEPRDPENHPIKAPGHVVVEALEITPEGLKRPLSAWEVPPLALRGTWQNGLFNTGYLLTFPWKEFPSTDRLRVRVRFTMLDGRAFEADKDVTVRVIPEPHRPRIVPGPSIGPPVLPPPKPLPQEQAPSPVLPPPTVVPPRETLPAPTPEGPVLSAVPAQLSRPVRWKAD